MTTTTHKTTNETTHEDAMTTSEPANVNLQTTEDTALKLDQDN